MFKHTNLLEISDIPSWELPILVYFYEIQLHVSKYAKHLQKYVCFHYKYHLSQLIYLINAEKHQITWNKWYSKLGSDPSWNISMKSN